MEINVAWTKLDHSRQFEDLFGLPPMAIALLTCLRTASAVKGGIPAEEILNYAAAYRFSKYSFNKYWPSVEKFFTLRGSTWFHTEDQDQLDSLEEHTLKFVKSGRKGSARRWHGSPIQSEIQFKNPQMGVIAPPIAPPSIRLSQKLEGRTIEEEYPPAATSLSGKAPHQEAAAASLPSEATPKPPPAPMVVKTASVAYVKGVWKRCIELGLQPPDEKFIDKLWERFPRIDPSKLPRLPDQRSPGLWLNKSEADLGMYIDTEGIRKPALSAKQAAQDAADERGMRMAFGENWKSQ
jgi:hypothetical protein